MTLYKWCFLALIASVPVLSLASIGSAPRRTSGGQSPLAAREHHLWNAAIHDSEFATLVHTASRISCGAAEPPQALATPDPSLEEAGVKSKISVSFIIGTDGHVHSPLILESAGVTGDRHVLQTVRTWRYRPATCNGVPTETEGKIEFSSR